MGTQDDLSSLFLPPPAGAAQPVRYRQGVVQSWNPETGENTVEVGGTVLSGLPILNTTDALLLTSGAVVAILVVGPSLCILGRVTIPGTPEAASALDAIRTESASVSSAETTASGTYTDLTTVGPEVTATVGPSGRCLVTVGGEIRAAAAAGAAIATGAGYIAPELSGANTLAPADDRAFLAWIRYDATPNSTLSIDIRVGASRTSLLTGLNPGETTFTARYRRDGTGTAEFTDRNITVVML